MLLLLLHVTASPKPWTKHFRKQDPNHCQSSAIPQEQNRQRGQQQFEMSCMKILGTGTNIWGQSKSKVLRGLCKSSLDHDPCAEAEFVFTLTLNKPQTQQINGPISICLCWGQGRINQLHITRLYFYSTCYVLLKQWVKLKSLFSLYLLLTICSLNPQSPSVWSQHAHHALCPPCRSLTRSDGKFPGEVRAASPAASAKSTVEGWIPISVDKKIF